MLLPAIPLFLNDALRQFNAVYGQSRIWNGIWAGFCAPNASLGMSGYTQTPALANNPNQQPSRSPARKCIKTTQNINDPVKSLC